MRSSISLLAVALFALAVGCTSPSENGDATTPAGATVVNAHCPIMGGHVTQDGGTANWDGKLVGFCCPSCIPKWEELSDAEKADKLAASESHDHDHDHNKVDDNGVGAGDNATDQGAS